MVISRRKRATDQPDSPGIDNKKLKTLDNKSSVGDSDTDDSLQGLGKEEKKKKRKARNQRKYYQRYVFLMSLLLNFGDTLRLQEINLSSKRRLAKGQRGKPPNI